MYRFRVTVAVYGPNGEPNQGMQRVFELPFVPFQGLVLGIQSPKDWLIGAGVHEDLAEVTISGEIGWDLERSEFYTMHHDKELTAMWERRHSIGMDLAETEDDFTIEAKVRDWVGLGFETVQAAQDDV